MHYVYQAIPCRRRFKFPHVGKNESKVTEEDGRDYTVRLAEILVYTDIRQLHQIASYYRCQCNPHSKNELITTLLANLRSATTIRAEVEGLSPSELQFMLSLFLDRRTQFSLEDLLAKAAASMEGEEKNRKEMARKLVTAGFQRGWIYPQKGKAISQFNVPSDLREPYIQAGLNLWKAHCSLKDALSAYRDEGTAIFDDILVFLQFISREPVPLTAEGGMYKRYQSQLFQFLSVREEVLGPQKWRFGYGLHFDVYPDRFSLLYDYCYFQRWIQEEANQVSLTDTGMDVLRSGLAPSVYDEVIRFWLRVYKRPIPHLPTIIQLIPLLAGDSWISQSDLEQILLPWIKPFYYEEPLQILRLRILKMMVHLGLLKAGTERNDWFYAPTRAYHKWIREYNSFAETAILLK